MFVETYSQFDQPSVRFQLVIESWYHLQILVLDGASVLKIAASKYQTPALNPEKAALAYPSRHSYSKPILRGSSGENLAGVIGWFWDSLFFPIMKVQKWPCKNLVTQHHDGWKSCNASLVFMLSEKGTQKQFLAETIEWIETLQYLVPCKQKAGTGRFHEVIWTPTSTRLQPSKHKLNQSTKKVRARAFGEFLKIQIFAIGRCTLSLTAQVSREVLSAWPVWGVKTMDPKSSSHFTSS